MISSSTSPEQGNVSKRHHLIVQSRTNSVYKSHAPPICFLVIELTKCQTYLPLNARFQQFLTLLCDCPALRNIDPHFSKPNAPLLSGKAKPNNPEYLLNTLLNKEKLVSETPQHRLYTEYMFLNAFSNYLPILRSGRFLVFDMSLTQDV